MKRLSSRLIPSLVFLTACAGTPAADAPAASSPPASPPPPASSAVTSALASAPPSMTASAAPIATAPPSATAVAAPAGPFPALDESAPAGVVELDAWVVDVYKCPPCPRGAMCKPCDAPNFTIGTRKDARGEEVRRIYADDAVPRGLVVGKRYHFKMDVRPAANRYARVVVLENKPLP